MLLYKYKNIIICKKMCYSMNKTNTIVEKKFKFREMMNIIKNMYLSLQNMYLCKA